MIGANYMNKELLNILELLLKKKSGYLTTQEMALTLSVSAKTVQRRLKALSEELGKNGAKISSIRSKGTRLVIEDESLFYAFLGDKPKETIFKVESPTQRIYYIGQLLLYTNSYIKSQELAEKLFISTSQLTKDLFEVKKILAEFNLRLSSKPNYGLKIIGTEFNKRAALANIYSSYSDLIPINQRLIKDYEVTISNIIKNVLFNRNIRMTPFAVHTISLHVLIAIDRSVAEYELTLNDNILKETADEMSIAQDIATQVENVLDVHLNKAEIIYISTRLFGRKQILNYNDLHGNSLMI